MAVFQQLIAHTSTSQMSSYTTGKGDSHSFLFFFFLYICNYFLCLYLISSYLLFKANNGSLFSLYQIGIFSMALTCLSDPSWFPLYAFWTLPQELNNSPVCFYYFCSCWEHTIGCITIIHLDTVLHSPPSVHYCFALLLTLTTILKCSQLCAYSCLSPNPYHCNEAHLI